MSRHVLFLAGLVALIAVNTATAQVQPAAAINPSATLWCEEDGDCCNCCGECFQPTCGPPTRLWAEADYLLWWVKGDRLPPLLTTSPAGTTRQQAGILGTPGTATLFGGQVNQDSRSGGRFDFGYWLNDEQTLGIEANILFLRAASTAAVFSSSGNPILTRPFFDTFTGRPNAELVAFPGLLNGSATICDGASAFNGQELLLRCNWCCACNYRLDLLGGWRRLGYNNNLGIGEALVSTGPLSVTGVPPGTTFSVSDYFATTNNSALSERNWQMRLS